MPALFIDAERLRDLNSGLGQVCLHLSRELVRQQPDGWTLTFLVPSGQTGVFGSQVNYIEASWLRKVWIPGRYDVWHCLHQDSSYLPRSGQAKLILTIHDLNFLERPDYSHAKRARKLATLQRRVDQADALTAISAYTASVVQENLLSVTQFCPSAGPLPDAVCADVAHGQRVRRTQLHAAYSAAEHSVRQG